LADVWNVVVLFEESYEQEKLEQKIKYWKQLGIVSAVVFYYRR